MKTGVNKIIENLLLCPLPKFDTTCTLHFIVKQYLAVFIPPAVYLFLHFFVVSPNYSFFCSLSLSQSSRPFFSLSLSILPSFLLSLIPPVLSSLSHSSLPFFSLSFPLPFFSLNPPFLCSLSIPSSLSLSVSLCLSLCLSLPLSICSISFFFQLSSLTQLTHS